MTQNPEPDWSTRLAFSIAHEVRRHRLAQGLSAQQLSDRCAEAGMPIQRSVLANLESGRRTTVTVAEVLVIARALGLPPGVLLFPVGYVADFEILPGGWQEPHVGLDWFGGQLAFSSDDAGSLKDSPLALIREHQSLVRNLIRTRQTQMAFRARLEWAQQQASDFSSKSAELDRKLTEIRRELVRAVDEGLFQDQEMFRLQGEEEALVKRQEEGARVLAECDFLAHTLTSHEMSVSHMEARLKDYRKMLVDRGLAPPLLPAELEYLEPAAMNRREKDRAPMRDTGIAHGSGTSEAGVSRLRASELESEADPRQEKADRLRAMADLLQGENGIAELFRIAADKIDVLLPDEERGGG